MNWKPLIFGVIAGVAVGYFRIRNGGATPATPSMYRVGG